MQCGLLARLDGVPPLRASPLPALLLCLHHWLANGAGTLPFLTYRRRPPVWAHASAVHAALLEPGSGYDAAEVEAEVRHTPAHVCTLLGVV